MLGLLAVLSVGAAVMAYRTSGPTVPVLGHLVPETPTFDFGSVHQGDIKSAEFVFRNAGDFEVTIHDVSASCSCQETKLDTKVVPPGGRAKLSLVWRVGARRGTISDGLGLVYTTATPPETPPADLRAVGVAVKASIAAEIEVNPVRIEFTAGQPGQATVQLQPGTRKEFLVARVSVTSAAVAATYNAEQQLITLHYTPQGEFDASSGHSVVLETDSPIEPIIQLPLSIIPAPVAD